MNPTTLRLVKTFADRRWKTWSRWNSRIDRSPTGAVNCWLARAATRNWRNCHQWHVQFLEQPYWRKGHSARAGGVKDDAPWEAQLEKARPRQGCGHRSALSQGVGF